MLANHASSTPPITTDSSDQMMQDGTGRLWTSLGQSLGLKMAWRRLPVFRGDGAARESAPHRTAPIAQLRSCRQSESYLDSLGAVFGTDKSACGKFSRGFSTVPGGSRANRRLAGLGMVCRPHLVQL